MGSSSCEWPAADLMHMHSHWWVDASQEVAVRNHWWSSLVKLSVSSLYSCEKSVPITGWRGDSSQMENCNALHMLMYLSVPLLVLLYLPMRAPWTGARRPPCCWSRAHRPRDNTLVWLHLWLRMSMVSFPQLWLLQVSLQNSFWICSFIPDFLLHSLSGPECGLAYHQEQSPWLILPWMRV